MQSRVVVIVGAGAVVLAVGIGLWWLTAGSAPESAQKAADTPLPQPSPTVSRSAPKPEPPPPSRATPPPVATPEPAAPTTGTLLIKSDAPDTSVFIDRVYLGTAPVTAKNLTPGTHHLTLSATGYDSYSEDIDVAVGAHEIERSVKTIRLDAKAEVVHKHSFGSCKGTLHATPQGITYETTNKDDGFTVALTDLEKFELDYLKKQLTLKIKKGKSYTFTDPDDNVDRLYAFHQDVEKVRKKLGGL